MKFVCSVKGGGGGEIERRSMADNRTSKKKNKDK